MARGVVAQVIEQLLEQEPKLTTKVVADRAGVSRQAAQKQLKLLVSTGVLSVEGKARAAKYSRPDADVRALKAKVSNLAELLRFQREDPKPVVVPPPAVLSPVVLAPQVVETPVVDDAAPVDDAPIVAPRPTVDDLGRRKVVPLPRKLTLAVAESGSLYRLSARLLLSDVAADVLTLDFNGVMEASEEFLEEVFVRWAEANPSSVLRVVNVPEALQERVARFA